MNVVAASEKKSFFSINLFLLRLLPSGYIEKLFIKESTPLFLLMLTIAASVLNPCLFTKYIPYLTLGCACLTFRFKTIGLSISYIAIALFLVLFAPCLPDNVCLWQMGIVFALAISLFILLLTTEELEAQVQEWKNQIQVAVTSSHQNALDIQIAKKNHIDKEKEFQEEIDKLKREAEQRRIEKIQADQLFALVQSEIDLLTAQKEKFIEEARNAKEQAGQHLQNLDRQKKQWEQSYEELTAARQKALDEIKELTNKLADLQQVNELLSLEFEDSKHIVTELQETLKSHQEAVVVFQHKLALAESAQTEQAQQQINELNIQLTQQKELNQQLEQEFEEKRCMLAEVQKDLLALQQQPIEVPVPEKVIQEVADLQKALAKAEGRYSQLREQFVEKNQILAQTRRELFHAQGKLIAFEKEFADAQLDPDRTDYVLLEKEMARVIEEVEHLEKEIIALEGLISHILTQ